MSQDFWKTQLNQKDPEFPEYLSFSTYQQLTKCPKQWFLLNSEYPEIWSKKGYPRKVNEFTIMGSAVHQSLEIIIDKMKEESIDFGSKNYIRLIKELGGLRNILKGEIEQLLDQSQYSENPRYLRVRKNLSLKIKKNLLETYFRQLRTLLAKLNLPVKSETNKQISKKSSRELPSVMTERYVQSEAMKWKGIIDLVINDGNGVKLIDFKTGKEKDSHKDQLELYQVIWMDDDHVNELPVKELSIKYPKVEKCYEPLEISEAESLKAKYKDITEELKENNLSEFSASPSEENCKYCDVKQICNEFWETMQPSEDKDFGDSEIEIQANGDQEDVSARIIHSNVAETDSIVNISFQDVGDNYREFFTPEKRLRVLNGHHYNEEEVGKDFIHIQQRTEVFIINE